MTKIFLATPAFLGKVNIQYAISLTNTSLLLHERQIPLQTHISFARSLIILSRNEILQAFLNSDCTHILCIDSDLGWPPEAVLNLLNKNRDFIGGTYPSRNDGLFRFRPLTLSDGSIVHEDGLLEMAAMPAGFMLIKRHVIEKMIADTPQYAYQIKNKSKPPGHCLFNTGVIDGEFWGEDYFFCRLARQSGFRLWLDPTINFNHDGIVGKLIDKLSLQPHNGNG